MIDQALWQELPLFCDQIATLDTRSCQVPMSEFTTTLGYALFDPIKVRISAVNSKGQTANPSETSDSAATARTVPQQMASASIQRHTATTESIVKLQWTALTMAEETGDSSILSYELQYDQASDNWISVVGDSSNYLLTEANVTQSITPGATYQFRIRAKNVYGWAE